MLQRRPASRHTHLPYEFLDGLVDGIRAKVELGGDAPGLLCQCHAALRICVEGNGRIGSDGRFGADQRFFIEGRLAGRSGRGGSVPMVVCAEEAQKLVRQAGGQEDGTK